MSDRVVVVGAGQAGASLVAKLRALGHSGAITLIGAEPVAPYQRPPLSKKYLLGEASADRLLLRPETFYAENNITLITDAPVHRVDLEAHIIHLDAQTIEYDTLALTTGSLPRTLPAAIGGDLSGVYVVRTLADVDSMAHEFDAGRRVLIVGGGYIGLEAAAVASSRQLATTLIELAPRILNRVAASETAEFFRDLHTGRGVDVREGVGLDRLAGSDGRVTSAVLSNGEEIDVDFVIVGIGINPDTRLAQDAGLDIDNGIATDAQCRTSDAAVYAAGDCASFPWQGGRLRLESVQNAIDQAEHAAAAIMGETAPYQPYPWFWSDQFDCRLQIAGLNTGYTHTIVRPGSRPGGKSVWYFKENEFLAVDAMNDARAYMLGKRWLEQGTNPLAARLADPEIELKQVV